MDYIHIVLYWLCSQRWTIYTLYYIGCVLRDGLYTHCIILAVFSEMDYNYTHCIIIIGCVLRDGLYTHCIILAVFSEMDYNYTHCIIIIGCVLRDGL